MAGGSPPAWREPLLRELHSVEVGEVRVEEPMWRHTTLRVGGPAQVMVFPRKEEHVEHLLSACARVEAPLFPLGRGSNLLVRDEGLPMVVVNTQHLNAARLEGTRLTAWAGFTLGGVAVRTSRAGLLGLEFAAGIPGSVGGGVYMNAGAHGGELGRHVVRVGFLPLTPAKPGAPGGLVGEAQVWAGPALGFAYRTSRFQSERGVILWAELEGEPGDPQVSRQRLRAFAAERRQRQPVAWPNCGSVFRNPPGHRAGALVEAVGGKGRRVGQAQISPKHANFIVNLGGARAQDVLALMDWAREQVWRAFGVELEPEVCVVPGEGVEA